MGVDVRNASLLGAPQFHGAELDKSWSGRCDNLARAAERLGEIGCQDALMFLRSSFSAPNVLHILQRGWLRDEIKCRLRESNPDTVTHSSRLLIGLSVG